MTALNGWYTHCWRSEGRGERGLPAGKAEKMDKISAQMINGISSRRGERSGNFSYLSHAHGDL